MKKNVAKLGELASFLSGFAFESKYFNDNQGMPVVRIRDVIPGVSETYYRGSFDERYVVDDGDYLIGMDGEFNLARWRGGRALLNQRVCKIDDVAPGLDRDYLARILPGVLKQIEDKTPFVTVKHLSVKSLLDIDIPVPSMEEQRQVVRVLDRADALRAKRREVLARLDELAQSIFLDMFGDPVRNPFGWPRIALREVLHAIDSGRSPVCLDRPASADEWGVLKLGAVTSCEFLPHQNKALPPDVEPFPEWEVAEGDLLFSRKNTLDLVAACALVRATPRRLLMPDLIFRLQIRPDGRLIKEYLHGLLTNSTKRKQVQALASGSAGSMPNISKGRLLDLEIELPPFDIQATYSARMEAIWSMRAMQRSASLELDALFASLQYRAFRGEL